MGGGWPTACLVFAVLTADVRGEGRNGGEDERWSRPATPERRQGDWVPLTCANCRLIDQGVQASNSLPSVLTPPPRIEEARLLPPPPPPDGLFQQAATGFLQAFTQQQPPQRKPQQFLQETTAQSISRPQAQFLKPNNAFVNSKPSQQFFQEPSSDFQPPQQPQQLNNQQSNRQPQMLQFNQQPFIPDNGPFLNQPLLIGPQFLTAPFFPQPSIPAQNIQHINPIHIQPQSPISPNTSPVNKQNFQIPVDRPVFLEQITVGNQQQTSAPQQVITQTSAPQEQYSVNGTESQNDEGSREEVQLLYVPVETLNQRARNLGRQKSLPSNQQDITTQVAETDSNRFTSAEQNYQFATRKPHLEDQENFNTQTHTSKHHYNNKQNVQYQQQLPLEDQERFNTQTHSVRQQFNIQPQNEYFQQQPSAVHNENVKLESQNTKQQYNFKTHDQFQQQPIQDQSNLNSQFNIQQNGQFQQHPPLKDFENLQIQTQHTKQHDLTLNDHYDKHTQQNLPNFNVQTFNANQQFNTQHNVNSFQQQLPPVEQENFNSRGQVVKQQFNANQHPSFQQAQVKEQIFTPQKDQTYVDDNIQLDQQLSTEPAKIQEQVSTQQTQSQQQFDLPEIHQQTASPVTQTRIPETYTTQQTKKQRFRNSQQGTIRNAQQLQNSQFLRQFPEDYQKPEEVSSNLPPAQNVETLGQVHNIRKNQHQSWTNEKNSNRNLFNQQEEISSQQQYDTQQLKQFHSDSHQASNLAPVSSTLPPPLTTPAPNQPPLSVYMETTEDTKVNDVLRLLKNAKTIQVLDTVGPDSPQVFVGPSNLKAPSGYIKFELPYLNSLDSNRVERKVDKLPFFVAPLNFNPPPGYSKIPFPAPHIGSVVVSNVTVLKTALHEKPFENGLQTVSSSERYLDQFTLPAEIPSISPQLPSLINSLQDEIYSGSSTSAFPPTTTETTTTAYTTPSYRGRGSSRGSYRGSSNYPTSSSPTRKPQTRTRRPYDGRPYSRRQPITTTTTLEPSTEAPVQEQFTHQPDQLTFNSEAYVVQNSAVPVQIQTGSSQPNSQSGSVNTYYDERFVANQFNPDQFTSQQQQQISQPKENQNVQSVAVISNVQNNDQYHQNTEVPNNFAVEAVAHTTAVPTVASPGAQWEEQTFKSQRPSGSRRDPSRQHQRFRGRQRLTTTTTEAYDKTVEPEESQFTQQGDTNVNYQNIPNRNRLRNHNQHRLVENTHFEANLPENKYNIQTERADVGFQTTERLLPVQNGEQFIQHKNNKDQLNSKLNTDNQYQLPILSQVSEPNAHQAGLQYQIQELQAQFPQQKANLDESNFNVSQPQRQFDYVPAPQQNAQSQYAINQFHQLSSQRDLLPQTSNPQDPQANFQQVNLDNGRSIGHILNQAQQNYYDQSTQQKQQEEPSIVHEQTQTQNQEQYNKQQLFLLEQEKARNPTNFNHDLQGQHFSTSDQFEQVSEVTATPLPETPVQTPQTETLHSQVENEPQIQQYNQQRLVKYSRPQSRIPAAADTSSTEEQTSNFGRGQYQFQANIDSSDASTTEAATTRSSLVRVRGRVRSRQRGSTRNDPTTTEAPNYPTTYLSRQRNSQEREQNQEYTPRKRVNYSNRQTYSLPKNSKINKEVNTDQSITPEINYASTEKQSTSEKFLDYTDVSTTTTEASTTKPMRRFQHILNRNKVRRTRPTNTPSTSGSSGTTKFLLPTTPPPVTRLSSSRGRIRKPVSTTTTTEYPQVNPSWNERDNFAPSAGSNEILEPLYQTRDKIQSSFGFQRTPVAPIVPQRTSPKPIASTDDEEFWNQAVTIQQSTSFDFKPDVSAVTPASFPANNKGQFQGTFSPIWNGQIELQDGNYFDVYNQQQVGKKDNDQTPFSSDHQKVVYKESKSRQPVGKVNQYTEKIYEAKKPTATEEEESLSNERVYPVYREIIKPAETIQEETSLDIADPYEVEGKNLHEKDITETTEQHNKNVPNEDVVNTETESEIKEGTLKRKIFATNSGKKGVRRRGSWVRVRVRKPQDMFETAESQNLASLSENAIQAVTKSLGDKVKWTPEPVTELPQTTTTEAAHEPSETINFEEALKDMLKEFITNPEGENKEDTEIEVITSLPSQSDLTNSTVPAEEFKLREEEQQIQGEDLEEQNVGVKVTQNEDVTEPKSTSEDKESEEPVKTVIPEVTTEVFTQEPTTIFQTFENVDTLDTTVEPDVTTTTNGQVYKNQHSRVLGTSTTTEISLETEICYRGRCVKTRKVDSDGDLLTTE